MENRIKRSGDIKSKNTNMAMAIIRGNIKVTISDKLLKNEKEESFDSPFSTYIN